MASKGTQTYQFDYGNRLRNVPGKETGYQYDALGRRVYSSTTGSSYIVSQYSQGGVLLYQQDFKRAKGLEYVYLGGSLVAFRETPHGTSTSVVKYQHTDALGTPIAVTDAAKAIVQTSEYEPYGQLVNSTLKDGPGYTGHVQDAATGLTYMQQRYYDPQVGRFLSVDPVTALSSPAVHFHRYRYANNNPYKFVDLDGRSGSMRDHPGINQSGVEGAPNSPESFIPMHSLYRPRGEEAKTEHVWSGAWGVAQAISGGAEIPAKDEDNDGDTHCAELIKHPSTFGAAHTSKWSEGRAVEPGAAIKPGTAIATFDQNGRYPSSDVKHAAVFIGYSPDGNGIRVLDQWDGTGNIQYRDLPWKTDYGDPHTDYVNSASNFSTIKW